MLFAHRRDDLALTMLREREREKVRTLYCTSMRYVFSDALMTQ